MDKQLLSTTDEDSRAIGAFCTDIKNSVERIDRYGQEAFDHHAAYIETVAETYGKQMKIQKIISPGINTLIKNSNFWIPGDALWGVVFNEPGKSALDSMIASFARIMNACAYGLITAQNYASENNIDPLQIRAAMIAGQVLEKRLKELDSPLFNGNSLNACGRLQGDASANSIILGFSQPIEELDSGALVELNIGSPEVKVSDLHDCIAELIRNYPELRECRPGCKITLEVLNSATKENYIRFRSGPNHIRGLKGCNVVTTEVKLELDQNQRGIRLIEKNSGYWARATVQLENKPEKISLETLIKKVPQCEFTLPTVFASDHVIIHIPQSSGQNFKIFYDQNSRSPRAGINRRPDKQIDFSTDDFCCIPIYKASDKGNVLLIKGSVSENRNSLVLHEITIDIDRKYPDLSRFIDSAGSCAEFVLN